jgi:predicted PurR-regulated permease PerM
MMSEEGSIVAQRDDRPLPEVPVGGLPSNRQPAALRVVWRNHWVRAITYMLLIAWVVYWLYTARANYMFALQVGFIGFLLAYVLNPFVALLMRLRMRRAFAVVITYLLVVGLIAVGSLVVTQVVTEAANFVALVPTAFDTLSRIVTDAQTWVIGWLDRLPAFLSDRFGVLDPDGAITQQIRERLVTVAQDLGTGFGTALEAVVSGGPSVLFSGATAVISVTLQIALIVLASVYFLYDYPRFVTNFRRHIPVKYRPVVADVTEKADVAVGGYLRGQLLITTILGVLVWLGLTIVGVPLATAIAFIAALFNLVPFLGPVVGAVPAVLLGLTVSPLTAVLAIVVFIVANQLEGNVLSPMILSRSTNLHPVTVLLAIMTGLGLFGIIGALLAVPTVAFLKVIIEDYVLKRPEFASVPPPPVGLAEERPEDPF